LRGLRKERTPQQDSGPDEKGEEAKRFRERKVKLGEGEGVDSGEGEESEG
jgi:hypothetical protein